MRTRAPDRNTGLSCYPEVLRQNCRNPSEDPPPWAEDHSPRAGEQVRDWNPARWPVGCFCVRLFLPYRVFLVISRLFVGAHRLSLAVAHGLFVIVHGLLLLQALECAGSVVMA